MCARDRCSVGQDGVYTLGVQHVVSEEVVFYPLRLEECQNVRLSRELPYLRQRVSLCTGIS